MYFLRQDKSTWVTGGISSFVGFISSRFITGQSVGLNLILKSVEKVFILTSNLKSQLAG